MSTAPDALTLLKHDHDRCRELFAEYDSLGDGAAGTRRDLVGRIVRELAVHTWIEEQILYPRIREAGRKIEDEVLEGIEEHHLIKVALAELERMTPEDERFDAKVEVLSELVEHHVEEEESDMFPRVRRALAAAELSELGAALEAGKERAPLRADPSAPDEPAAAGRADGRRGA